MAAITFDDGYAGVFEHALPVLVALDLPATVFLVSDAVGQPSGFWWDQPEIVQSITPDRRQRWLTELRGDAEAILSGNMTASTHESPDSHRPADWTTIRAWLGTGIEFGVHSATHRALPALSDCELEYEVVASRARLHQATGVWPDFFAYPYGLWDSRVRDCVHRAGYRAGLTLDYGLNAAVSNPSALRRINVPAGISEPAFEVWAAGLRPSDLTHWRS
jgi:peptidoglycan/xylan/chitin deacetylase (PgdA/CDA1 family)